LRATLGDWRFVAFVSTLLLCGLPAPAHASPHSVRRAPTRASAGSVRAGSVRVVFGADSAFGGDGAFEHVDAAPLAPSHEWLPATFDLDPANATDDDDDDDDVTSPAAAGDDRGFNGTSPGSVIHSRSFVCLARSCAVPLVRGPPRVHPIARSISLSPRRPVRRRRAFDARPSRLASTREPAATFAPPAPGGAILVPLVFTHADMRAVGRRLLRAPPP